MKRWRSQNERIMIGGLFLLLLASSFPWTGGNSLELGSANLSTMKKPDGITIDENDDLFQSVDKSQDDDDSESDRPSKKKKLKTKKKVTEVDDEEESDDSVIRRQFKVGEKVLEATYEASEEDDSKTLVTLAPRNETEGQTCVECKTYEVNHPLEDGNITNIRAINLAIKDSLKAKKKKKIELVHSSHSRKNKLVEIDDDNSDHSEQDVTEDPIKKACRNKKGKDSYTLCAMKELGRIANISGDEAYDASEIQDLFEKHIFKNLQSQLKDGTNANRQDDAKIAISNLIEKLDDSNSDGLRTVLTKLKQIPLIIEAQKLANLERESKALAKTNPARALRSLNEFNMRRWNFERTLGEDMYDTALTYENLVGDNFSRDRAMSQFYDSFVDPITPYHDALWSNDPFNSMRGLQTQNNYGSPINNPALRGARDQGRGGFPPIGQNGRNFPSRGTNNRSLPQGPGFNRGSQNNNGFANNSGLPSRFGAPTSNPGYNNSGYAPNRFGAPNVLAPYNQSAANNGRPYGSTSPGFMGNNGPGGVRTPVLNGANYYSGYNNCYGNPFAYRQGGNGTFSYQGGCAPNGNINPYPQTSMPYGAPGMSAARPRF